MWKRPFNKDNGMVRQEFYYGFQVGSDKVYAMGLRKLGRASEPNPGWRRYQPSV
jgi:hypothetical protein